MSKLNPIKAALAVAIKKEDAIATETGNPIKEYAFDCKLAAALRVKARSQEDAEEIIRKILDAADCNAGCWPDGSPVLFEASLDGELSLFEVDGEPAPTEDDVATIINNLSRETAIDILDEYLGVDGYDDKDDDAVRADVLRAYQAGSIAGIDIKEAA